MVPLPTLQTQLEKSCLFYRQQTLHLWENLLPPHHGGQNPIEPVALSLPLVMGPNHQNFRETCSELVTQKALSNWKKCF